MANLNTYIFGMLATNKKVILKIILFTLFFCGISETTRAQYTITGQVINRNKECIPDLPVTLKQLSDSSIINYTFTDKSGYFKIAYKSNASHLLIQVSGFNIKSQLREIANQNQEIIFIIEEENIQLKQVVVKAPKIWGIKDTINYSVSAFSSTNDIVIGDVLKKMPGIEVSGGGQISYNGKAINKFYIENMDMLQGRYGIATNNIAAKDVSTVQVYENHQPVKALEKTRMSDQAAINIKLKDEAKGTYAITATLGIGMDKNTVLWQNELTGMKFAKKKQTMFIYKGNNTGVDIANELRSFTVNTAIGGGNFLSLQTPSPPGINKSRYYFNTSNAITACNLVKLKNDGELTYNIIYLHNDEKRNSNARTSYFFPGDSVLTITENLNSKQNLDRLEAEINYNMNKEDSYFNNYSNIEVNWERGKGEILSVEEIRQQMKNKSIKASNTTHWIKNNKEGRGVEVSSSNIFKSQPQNMVIKPGLYPDIFNAGNDYEALRQDARFNNFKSSNSLSFLSALYLNNFRLSPRINASIENQDLHSELFSENIQIQSSSNLPDSMRNKLSWTQLITGVSIGGTYKIEKFNVDFSFPANYFHTFLKNDTEESSNSFNKIYFQPSMFAKYIPVPNLEITGSYSFYNQTPNLQNLYTGYILENYRSLNRYNNQLSNISKGNGGSIGISYKNIIWMFFANAGASYNYFKSDVLYGQNFEGVLAVTQFLEMPNSGKRFSFNGKLSKGFDWKGIVLSMNGSWGRSYSMQLRQEKLVDYTNEGLSLNASLNSKITPWLFFTYKGNWHKSKGYADAEEKTSSIRTFINNGIIEITLPKEIGLNASYEHYYNSAASENKYFSLADISLNYTWKQIRFDLCWNNIFNTSKYISAYYGSLNTYYSEYTIRPASILLKIRCKLF